MVLLASYPDSTSNAVKTSFIQIALIKILLLFIIILCFMSYLVALSGIPTINHFDKFFSYHKIKVCIFYGVMNTHETIPIKSINSDLHMYIYYFFTIIYPTFPTEDEKVCLEFVKSRPEQRYPPPHSCLSPGDSYNSDENITASKNNHFPKLFAKTSASSSLH